MENMQFKFSVNWAKSVFFCGLDIHKHEFSATIYSKDEKCEMKFKKTVVFRLNPAGLNSFWNFASKYSPAAFGMEATGIYHHIMVKFLKNKEKEVSWSFDIIIVNPADVKRLPGKSKTDRIDSEQLALYLSKGLLVSGRMVIEVLEDLKEIFRMGVRLERDRTALKNRIKKTLDRAGIRPRNFNLNNEWVLEFLHHFIDSDKNLGKFMEDALKKDGPLYGYRKNIIKHAGNLIPFSELKLSSPQRSIIRQNLVELEFKTGRKALLAIEIDQLLSNHPILRHNAKNLSTIPGISAFSAVWILSEVGNIKNFPTVRQFRAYCGCCPRILSSGEKVYSVKTMKRSNKYLRTIFYNAAVVVCNLVKKESDLKNYAKHVLSRKRGQSKKLVYCIVAGKIAEIVYAILRDGVPFSPFSSKKMNNKYITNNSDFTLTDKKLLRKARNLLKRVEIVPKIGILGEHAKSLAEGLDQVLKGQ
ncbi:MAG: IS110 family transposase [Promethearchaeota archaeon]